MFLRGILPRTATCLFCIILLQCIPAHADTKGFPGITDTTSREYRIIDSIRISGNHKTKDFIILQELGFRAGDTIAIGDLETVRQTALRQLVNTRLFLHAEITFELKAGDYASVQINVQERWYFFPEPWFELADRNFNVWWVEYGHTFDRTQYGIVLKQYNFTGRHDDMEIHAIMGFTRKLELYYTLPQFSGNTRFGGGLVVSYAANKQIAYITGDNRQIFIEDSIYLREKFRTELNLTFRNNLFDMSTLQLKYNYEHIDSSIAALNPAYLGDGRTSQRILSLSFFRTFNHTDNVAYPLRGYFARIGIAKVGLGIFRDVNQLDLTAQYNRYLVLRPGLYLQGEGRAALSFGNAYPYFNLLSLGYCEDFVRGYEYQLIDGEQTFLLRTQLSGRVLDFHLHTPWIDWPRFSDIPVHVYLKYFADGGYVHDTYFNAENPLTNRLQFGTGFGLDIATYYDWVFRALFAVNALGQFGVYLHVNLDLSTYENCNLW